MQELPWWGRAKVEAVVEALITQCDRAFMEVILEKGSHNVGP